MKPKLREIANLRATEISCESDKLHFVYIGRRDSYIQSGQICGPIRIYRVDRFVVQFVYTGWTVLWSSSSGHCIWLENSEEEDDFQILRLGFITIYTLKLLHAVINRM